MNNTNLSKLFSWTWVQVIFVLVTLLSITSFAHDTWLIPVRFFVPAGANLSLDLTSGMAFPSLDTSIKQERIDRAMYRISGRQVDLNQISPAPRSLKFSVMVSDPGIATFWVDLKPRTLELTPAQVQEYFEEIGASSEIRQRWAQTARPRRWRETYTKHAKTFVRIGSSEGDATWKTPVGMSFEIVPEKDPTSLKSGEDLPVQLIRNNVPVANFYVGIVSAGSKKGEMRKTDNNGRVTFRIAKPGRWMIRATDLRRRPDVETEWESDFTTMTFEVFAKSAGGRTYGAR